MFTRDNLVMLVNACHDLSDLDDYGILQTAPINIIHSLIKWMDSNGIDTSRFRIPSREYVRSGRKEYHTSQYGSLKAMLSILDSIICDKAMELSVSIPERDMGVESPLGEYTKHMMF